jgi:hypothetical protein
MTRAQAWIAASISAVALVTVPMIPQTTTAQQEKPCADRSRQRLTVTLARQVNTAEIRSHQRTNTYQPMSAFPEIRVPAGFTLQLVTNATGSEYVFSVKDTQDPCGFTVFSDQEQLIYTAQPLR